MAKSPTQARSQSLGMRQVPHSRAARSRPDPVLLGALQRLGGVTQVTGSESGHTFHTRLTHSLKVAQVARRLAEKLLQGQSQMGSRAARALAALDPDAAEAAGLAHDLGHPPFGHVAEEILRDHTSASFEGNPQSFRIVTNLAVRTVDAPGLALTSGTRRRQSLGERDGCYRLPTKGGLTRRKRPRHARVS